MLVVIGKSALNSGRRAPSVGPYSRGMVKAEVEFKRKRAGSKGDKAFYSVKSGSRLSERAIPENGC